MSQHRYDVMESEPLLEQASWAHSLARSLVGEGAADDLVQDTWVAALGSKPEPRKSLRPWLGTVLGNLARQGWRSSAHRQQREQRAAREEAMPSAADLTERAESQRMLMDELLKLPESQREILLLRYFEDLSAAEIGRRQGLAASTVKSRIARALETLREGLDDHFEGGRETWAMALLPLLPAPAAQVAIPPSSGLGVPGLIKLGPWLLLGAVGVFGLCAIIVSLLPGVPAPEEIAREDVGFEALDLRAVQEQRPASLASNRKAILGGSASAPDTSVTQFRTNLQVRFLDHDGSPVQGVRLHIKRPNEVGLPHSDAAGRIEFSLMHPEAQQSYNAVYSHPGLASDRLSFHTGEGATLDLGDILTHPGGALRGHVTDGLGKPLANATVHVDGAPLMQREASGMNSSTLTTLGRSQTTTDERGDFRLSGLLAGDVRVNVRSSQELHIARSGWVEIRAGQESTGLVIHAPEAQPEMRIEGHVYAPDGSPTHATIRARYEGMFSSGSMTRNANKHGFFRLSLHKEIDHDLVISAPVGSNWAPIVLPDIASGSLDLDLHFSLGPSFQLQATNTTGEHLPEFSCTVLDSKKENVLEDIRLGQVSSEGLEVRLPMEDFFIRVRSPGYAEKTYAMEAGQVHPGKSFSIALRRLPGIRGHVRHEGVPVGGAVLYLQSVANQRSMFNGFPVRYEARGVTSTKSNEDGSFELELQEDGDYVVRAVAAGMAPTESSPVHMIVERGVEGLQLNLSRGGAIGGIVVAEPGRNAAQTIVAISRGDCWAETQRTAADGSYLFENLTPGSWMVKIVDEEIDEASYWISTGPRGSAPSPQGSNCQVLEGGHSRFDLALDNLPFSTLNGRFKLTGIDMSLWRCELLPADLAREQRAGLQSSFPMNAEGEFELSVAGEGQWILVMFEPEGRLRLAASIVLQAGQNHWSREVNVAWLNVLEGTQSHSYYLCDLGTGLSASLALGGEEQPNAPWQMVPAGTGQIHVLPDDLLTPQHADLTDPSNWPMLREITLQSGERRALQLPR